MAPARSADTGPSSSRWPRHTGRWSRATVIFTAWDPNCLGSDGTGTLLRDDEPTLRLPSADLARRFLQIWVEGEDELGNPRWAFGRC